MGTFYVLQFIRPIGNPGSPRGMAQHYTGWVPDPERRINAHVEGRLAKITQAVMAQGSASWWPRIPDTRADERRLKTKTKTKNARRCRVCQEVTR